MTRAILPYITLAEVAAVTEGEELGAGDESDQDVDGDHPRVLAWWSASVGHRRDLKLSRCWNCFMLLLIACL
jgi:hypothetical protein